MSLIRFTEKGLYCEKGGFYIDPWKPVDKALITHGHSDHSRWGHGQYITTHSSVPIIQHRLGAIKVMGMPYGDKLLINGVKVSFHPAGHILGSAQIRLEYKDEIWVVSGDYKPEPDNFSESFELVRCHHFITESTFGLPVFKWQKQSEIFEEMIGWWKNNKERGYISILAAYSLGKAQRIIQGLGPDLPGKIFTHGAIENMNEVIRKSGVPLHTTERITKEFNKNQLEGSLVLAPPGALDTPWSKKLGKSSTAVASGWMGLRGAKRRRAVDKGFILSDHADWKGLNDVIYQTGAENIYVTHGYTEIFSKWLREQGYNVQIVNTEFGGEIEDEPVSQEDQKIAS